MDVLLPSNSADRPGELARSGISGHLVVVVADGMGGHVGGRIASNLSSKYFLESVDQTDGDWSSRMDAAMQRANDVLRNATDARPELAGMGSTLLGGVLGEQGIGWVSVGDSGLYLCRDGVLHRLNEDHSFGAYLDQQAREGLIPPEVAATDRRRNQLFHALLGEPLDHYERFSGFRDLAVGDVILLASDGLKTLSDERIGAIISANSTLSPEHLVDQLLRAVEAENRERQDNTSLIVVRVASLDGGDPQRTVDHPTTVSLSQARETVDVTLIREEDGPDASTVVRHVAPSSAPAIPAAPTAPTAPPAVTKSPDPVVTVAPRKTSTVTVLVMTGLIGGLILLGGAVVWYVWGSWLQSLVAAARL